MRLNIVTIVLDGEPWIECHLPVFRNLKHEWRWIIVHGAAMNGGSTGWCAAQEPRLSLDGTSEYLASIDDPRVIRVERSSWESKDHMINAALFEIKSPCVLMQIDSDEIWRSEQLDKIVELFENDERLGSIMFACDYYVGPNLRLQGENCYGDYDYEWLRAWRFQPGMTFRTHEPPVLIGEKGYRMGKLESQGFVGKFSHYAYATESQVRYKEAFYGYHGLTEKWRLLQKQAQLERGLPIPLSYFFDHVKDEEALVIKA